jgi:hypothetical protein
MLSLTETREWDHMIDSISDQMILAFIKWHAHLISHGVSLSTIRCVLHVNKPWASNVLFLVKLENLGKILIKKFSFTLRNFNFKQNISFLS